MIEPYRSYVIRVRRPADGRDPVRLDLEDLIGGRRVALLGDEARSLAERLQSMLGDAAEPRPPARPGGPRPDDPGLGDPD
jgi:hypothetical protein